MTIKCYIMIYKLSLIDDVFFSEIFVIFMIYFVLFRILQEIKKKFM